MCYFLMSAVKLKISLTCSLPLFTVNVIHFPSVFIAAFYYKMCHLTLCNLEHYSKPYIVYVNQILYNFKEVLPNAWLWSMWSAKTRYKYISKTTSSYIYKIHIYYTGTDNSITHRSHIFFTFVHTSSEFLADVQSLFLLFTLFNVRAYVITWRVRRFLIGCLRSKRGLRSRSFSARIQWFCSDRTVICGWYPRYLQKLVRHVY